MTEKKRDVPRRVLLINPNTEQAPYPVAPLGLCLVAASLEPEFEVVVLDGTFTGAAGLAARIGEVNPDYIGIGIRNIDDVVLGSERYYPEAIKRDFIASIRAITTAPIILGGPGFSLFPHALLTELGADFGVVGEGERRFKALLRAIENGADPTDIDGVIVRDAPVSDGVVRLSSDAAGSLTLPFSSVDRYVDFAPYRVRGSYPIQTKRGCALNCVYCAYPLIEGRTYRLRSPADIVDEIASVSERLGAVTFEFVDSTFNVPLPHAVAICREIVERGLRVRLRSMGVNPRYITDELLEWMRRAGFAQIVASADTAAEETLARYGKGFSISQLRTAAALISKHGMPTMWSFIFGGPGETEATIEETFDFIDRYVNPDDMVHMTEGIRVYPGTPIFDIALREGLIRTTTPLLRPLFYVSPALGVGRLRAIMSEKTRTHPNCIRAAESDPGPERIREALALRAAENLDEPMFRTLIRLRTAAVDGGSLFGGNQNRHRRSHQ